MSALSPFRPVALVPLIAGLAVAGCADADGRRFEQLANHVADIPVSLQRPGARDQGVRSAAELGLRPASAAPLRVEVLDPHDLWEARDGSAQNLAVKAAQAAAPVVVQAAAREVEARVAPVVQSAADLGLRPARVDRPAQARQTSSRTVQIGAYSSPEAAGAAWAGLRGGTLSAYAPVYEPVEVNGRRLVRLKVVVPADEAARVCAAAGVTDPWCRRNG